MSEHARIEHFTGIQQIEDSNASIQNTVSYKLYRDLEMDGVVRPTAAEEHSQGRLLVGPKATRALLQFLASTSVALPRAHLQRTAERARRDDEWGLEALEKAIRTGEG